MTTAEILDEIAQQVAVCEKCELHFSRKNAVPGAGSITTEILFIGEGPGFHENEQGLPFVGRSGKFLDELLESCGMDRSTVFITNVVKCRPPGNRDPKTEELATCSRYLNRQIEAINPKVIVTLGRFSMAKFIANAKISQIHGQPRWVRGRLIVPMYHPAAALRLGSLRPVMKEDFAKLPQWIEEARRAVPDPSPDVVEYADTTESALDASAAQMDLFGAAPPASDTPQAGDPGEDDSSQPSLF
ncbi:MAG: uracil-DNA glycosylase [Anaerolineaceae bacterium]|nr:uracil-DNA glycosylase [Anaerolineaceae bacterium]